MSNGALRIALLVAAAGLAWPAAGASQEVGLRVGDRAPEFTLQDQGGEPRSLRELLKPGPLVIVFYRSADW